MLKQAESRLGFWNIQSLVACTAFTTGVLALGVTPAAAGCNSGNVANSWLLWDANCQATATANQSTAVGRQAEATQDGATAFGYNSHATGLQSTAIGSGIFATAQEATAVGANINIGRRGVAVGDWPAAALGAVAVGAYAKALGTLSIAIGGDNPGTVDTDGPHSPGSQSIAIGPGSLSTGTNSVSLGEFAGDGADSDNAFNTALGGEAGRFVTGLGNTAAGLAAGYTVKGDLNNALGNSAGQRVTGNRNVDVGASSGDTTNGDQNVAIGDVAGQHVTGDVNTALGNAAGSTVSGSANIALGLSAGQNVSGNWNIAIGSQTGSDINAQDTISIGHFAAATGGYSIGLGWGTTPTKLFSMALGTEASATAPNAIAMGREAKATQAGAVAIGQGSIANVANTVSVGSSTARRRITNLGGGIANTDAATLGQVKALIAAATRASPPASQGAAWLGGSDTGVAEDVYGSGAADRDGADTSAAANTSRRSGDAGGDDAAEDAPGQIVAWANVGGDGSLTGKRAIAGNSHAGRGHYEVVFKRKSLAACTFNATLSRPGLVTVSPSSGSNRMVVEIRNLTGALMDSPFYLMAVC